MERRSKKEKLGQDRRLDGDRGDRQVGQWGLRGKNVFPTLRWKGGGRGIRGRSGLLKGLLLAVMLSGLGAGRASAQIPGLDIIGEIAKRVVMAIDLKVQQAQEATMELQVAQRELENILVGSELSDIAGWLDEQRALFSEYYNELWQVKGVISGFVRVGQLIDEEVTVVSRYKQIWGVLSSDKHFTAGELSSMSHLLSGIVSASVTNVSRLSMVITSLVTQMGDADRLRMVDEAGTGVDKNYSDLQGFWQGCTLLSLERARDQNDLAATRALYGLQ